MSSWFQVLELINSIPPFPTVCTRLQEQQSQADVFQTGPSHRINLFLFFLVLKIGKFHRNLSLASTDKPDLKTMNLNCCVETIAWNQTAAFFFRWSMKSLVSTVPTTPYYLITKSLCSWLLFIQPLESLDLWILTLNLIVVLCKECFTRM